MLRRQLYVASALVEEFAARFIIARYEVAGSIRRKEATIGDADLVVAEPLALIEKRIAASRSPYVKIVRGQDKRLDVDYKELRFNIFYAEPEYWGAMLFYLTGPSGYGIAYRKMAKSKGWTLNQYGLFNGDDKAICSRTEREIYEALGKEYKEPELRGQ